MVTATRPATQRAKTASTLPLPFGIGLLLGGSVAIFSAGVGFIMDSTGSGPQWGSLAVGVFAIALGLVFTRFRYRGRILPAVAMSMLVASWLGLSIAGLLAFIVSGEFAGAGDALFETVSATTTTGFTTVSDPQLLPPTVRMLRVGLQWVTGLGVLAAGMGLLPAAVSGVELAPRRPLERSKRIVTSLGSAMRNIVALYLLLTTSLIVGYWIAGMSLFDAISYGFSTASTGGMANHANSIGHFDSAWIEYLATAGMIAAGGNLVVVWWAFRGAISPVWKSTELRLYLSLIALGTAIVWIRGAGLSIGDAAFATSSMLSTTGFRAANWGASNGLVHAVLLVGAGIGAMSGSVGSGFRLARVARIALEVRRSLRALLHPYRVEVIRMDGYAVDEDSLRETYGYLWIHLITLTALVAFVNAGGFDVIGTLSLSLSVLSNVGIALNGDRIDNVVLLGGWSQLVAAAGMVLGRMSIYPVLITASGFVRWLARFQPRRAAGSAR